MIFLIIFCCIAIIFIGFMVKLAFENNVKFHQVILDGSPEHVRLFFISDIHLRKINKKMIDALPKPVHAVIIGGDLAEKRTPISNIKYNLQLLNQVGPTYFVWGNNDREAGEETLRNVLQEENITIIENDSILLNGLSNHCRLAAIDDLTDGNPDIMKAFKKCHPNDNVFFICHNPQIFSEIQYNFHPKILMGGHFHGGQIRIGPFGLLPKGYFRTENGSTILISNGYGTTALPLRLGAKSECHIIDITFLSQNS